MSPNRNSGRRIDGIAWHLIAALVLFSTLITAITTGTELFLEYRSDITGIDKRIDFIQKSYLPTLVDSVWVDDDLQIMTQLEGLSRLPDIEYLAISVNGKTQWSVGEQSASRTISSDSPLVQRYRGQNVPIGNLKVVASVDNVLDRIEDKLIVTLVANFIRTLLIASFMLYLFHRLAGRHLTRIAQHMHLLARNPDEKLKLQLSRPEHGIWRPDLLDVVTGAINDLNTEIVRSHDSVHKLNTELTQRVEEREAQARILEEQSKRMQAILDNAVDGIITIDEKGIVSSMNKSAECIFDYVAGEVIGKNIHMLMPEPYHSAHDGYLRSYITTGKAQIIGIGREVMGLRKNGETFPMDLSVSEVSHQGKRMFVGLVRDITERKRAEKMKNEFVSTVSHELRTPLTSISGVLALATSGTLGKLPEQAKTMLDIAFKNSKHLANLINDLLDMEKIAAGKLNFELKTQPLQPLLEQAIEANRVYGEQFGVTYVLTGPAGDIQVLVDTQRLIQVLSNFLSNAAKFSPQGGSVEIDARHLEARVRVSVTDHGPGIPNEFRERIFQKFTQADASDTRQKGGTGLGLAISKELIEHMGGDIGFESKEGKGATFYFELPIQG